MQAANKRMIAHKIIALIIALLACLSVLFQLYLTPLTTIEYFSYFTSLSNLLVALSLTVAVLTPSSGTGVFFSRLSVQSAIALYITVVFLVYNIALRGIWHLTGWEYFWDNMVHVTNPVLYVAYWFFFRTRGVLQWKDSLRWMIFPFIYLVYCLARGAMVNWYPYPFLNAGKLGYPKALLNSSITLIVFLAGGLILIGITRAFLSRFVLKHSNDK